MEGQGGVMPPGKENEMKYIQATFTDGRTAVYTDSVLALMMGDNDVMEIVDMETGEVLKA
jgi:hypothetical protein